MSCRSMTSLSGRPSPGCRPRMRRCGASMRSASRGPWGPTGNMATKGRTALALRYGAAFGVVVLCIACIAVGAPVAAQPGQITGVVVDATGGVLPGATVTLSGGPSGPQQVQTDARGRFAFTGLALGVYTVSVYLNGFGEAAVHDVAVAGARRGSTPAASCCVPSLFRRAHVSWLLRSNAPASSAGGGTGVSYATNGPWLTS